MYLMLFPSTVCSGGRRSGTDGVARAEGCIVRVNDRDFRASNR